jgi:hypothetical protein
MSTPVTIPKFIIPDRVLFQSAEAFQTIVSFNNPSNHDW